MYFIKAIGPQAIVPVLLYMDISRNFALLVFNHLKHLNITIQGKVQKVSFRMSTKAVADYLAVSGFALNCPDGSLYIEAEGDDFSLKSFLEWCQEGPEKAVVEHVESVEAPVQGYKHFEVLKRMPGTQAK